MQLPDFEIYDYSVIKNTHVLLIDMSRCSGSVDQYLAVLPDHEKTTYRKANRFRIIARALLRLTIAEITGCYPHKIAIHKTPYGKPVIAGAGIDFNISHCEGWLMIAWNTEGVRVGCDIEVIEDGFLPDTDGLEGKILSERELVLYESMKMDLKFGFFIDIWTRKEAWMKSEGMGFHINPKLLCTVLPSGYSPWSGSKMDIVNKVIPGSGFRLVFSLCFLS